METIIVYTDGGSRGNPGPAGAGASIQDTSGAIIEEVSEFLGNGTNNFAEYQAVVLALYALKRRYGKETKDMHFELRMDSELVQKQLSGVYQIKEPGLIPQFIEIHNLRVAHFPNLTIMHVPREKNTEADRLANEAMNQGTKGF
ncbi:ribonuclease HI family protein [Candidatus Kaiserbacteria bacterium]|nr:ribonuclease HI family protein [Candidatus Kaiserbacteria bacterium]